MSEFRGNRSSLSPPYESPKPMLMLLPLMSHWNMIEKAVYFHGTSSVFKDK